MSENEKTADAPTQEKIEFKKPVLIGRIGQLPKKAKNEQEKPTETKSQEKSKENTSELNPKQFLPPAVLLKELSTPIPYKEPKWSGLCPDGEYIQVKMFCLCILYDLEYDMY